MKQRPDSLGRIMDQRRASSLDVLIIGSGQAGLAMGRAAQRAGLEFLIVDALPRVGDSWRRRYASLTLFTPRAYSGLPDLPLPGERYGYAGKDEFADYLESYARSFRLPVRSGAEVRVLRRDGRVFRAESGAGETWTPRAVVIATGGFQRPVVPPIGGGFAPDVLQLTSESYKDPSQIPTGASVLVVGDGATGRDIAAELAGSRMVFLAAGKKRRLLPEWILGKHVFWWLDKTGALWAPPSTPLGRLVRRTDAFPARGKTAKGLRRRGVNIVPRFAGADGRSARFSDGTLAQVDTVVWAAGYRDDTAWVDVPGIADSRGAFVHTQGQSPVPGLFFIGRPWQTSRGSAFIAGVGRDADRLIAPLSDHLKAAR